MRIARDQQRDILFWLWAWAPVAFAIGVIAIESQDFMGAEYTSHPLRWVWEHLFGHVPGHRWEMIHFYIRKSGHFLGYGLVGLAWLRAWWLTLPESNFLQDSTLAFLGTAVVASADEFHQTFLPSRTGLARDVVLDCLGAIALQLIVYLFMRLFRPKQLARA